MQFVQLTDTHVRAPGVHVNGFIDSNTMFAAAVEKTAELQPDCVLISGDLTDCGLVEEYAELRRLLAPLSMPVYLIPGNHDRRENLRAAFADAGYFPKRERGLYYSIDEHPVRLIGLDSVIPGHTHGELDPAQLDWLAQSLAAQPSKPTVLFIHHPPFPTGLGMDSINCRNGGDLRAIVEANPQVERVLCGHHHRPVVMRWGGTLASIAPSTAHQVDLALADQAERIRMEPPALQLHLYRPGVGLISHTAYVGDYGEAVDFVSDPAYPGKLAVSG